jgi:hypothetical protein
MFCIIHFRVLLFPRVSPVLASGTNESCRSMYRSELSIGSKESTEGCCCTAKTNDENIQACRKSAVGEKRVFGAGCYDVNDVKSWLLARALTARTARLPRLPTYLPTHLPACPPAAATALLQHYAPLLCACLRPHAAARMSSFSCRSRGLTTERRLLGKSWLFAAQPPFDVKLTFARICSVCFGNIALPTVATLIPVFATVPQRVGIDNVYSRDAVACHERGRKHE